jgi:probable rRNA maturation factor
MIKYYSEGVDMPEFYQVKVTEWAKRVISLNNKIAGEINFIFTGDKRLLQINKQFLDHDYFTDIITFDYSTPATVSGDIYISVETVASNAASLNISYAEELNRVIIHGILHLCGFKDKTDAEAVIMRKKENEALILLLNI